MLRTHYWAEQKTTTDPMSRTAVPRWLVRLGMVAHVLSELVRQYVLDDIQCAFDCLRPTPWTRETADWAGGWVL